MTTHTPLVTVLMSVKNGEPYVGETVRSVLAQTFKDFTFLIIDNASTDSTRKTIESFDDPRIELIALAEDAGQTGALNIGLAKAESQYVARLDADDVCMPERLAKQVAYLEANPDVALVGSAAQCIDQHGNNLHTVRFPQQHEDIIDHMPITNPIIHPSVMFRLQPVRSVGGYDATISYAQDLALWTSLAKESKLANIEDVLLKLRIHPGQETRNPALQTKRLEDNATLALRLAELPSASPKTRALARFRYAFMCLRLKEYSTAAQEMAGTLLAGPHHLLGNKQMYAAIWHGIKKAVANKLP